MITDEAVEAAAKGLLPALVNSSWSLPHEAGPRTFPAEGERLFAEYDGTFDIHAAAREIINAALPHILEGLAREAGEMRVLRVDRGVVSLRYDTPNASGAVDGLADWLRSLTPQMERK